MKMGGLSALLGVHLWDVPSCPVHLSFWVGGSRAAPVSHWQHSGEGGDAGLSPTLGALPGDCSDSCSDSSVPSCSWSPCWRWPFHLPIYLGWCWCVNESTTPARSQQSALHSAAVLCSLQGGLCHLCWQPGSPGLCVWGGSVPPSPELSVLLQDPGRQESP